MLLVLRVNTTGMSAPLVIENPGNGLDSIIEGPVPVESKHWGWLFSRKGKLWPVTVLLHHQNLSAVGHGIIEPGEVADRLP